jgi:hypothetical protein
MTRWLNVLTLRPILAYGQETGTAAALDLGCLQDCEEIRMAWQRPGAQQICGDRKSGSGIQDRGLAPVRCGAAIVCAASLAKGSKSAVERSK